MQISTVALFAAILFSLTHESAKAEQGWAHQTIAERGIRVALPSKPLRREISVPTQDGTLTVYESIEATNPPSKYSIFVATPERRGIFQPESMDAYLSAHVASMVRTVDSGKLLTSSRTIFRGRPALEYEFSHRLEGVAYLGRGITLMIDGGHIRLSMWHPIRDLRAKDKFRRFAESFELIPIQFSPAASRFADPRGLSFSPPLGWLQQPSQNPAQVARYSNLTRTLQLLVAGVSSYTCDNFSSQIRTSGRLKSAAPVRLADRQFLRVYSFEDVPKYNVRLTNVQYCLNSRLGAVVLGGTEEEAMFARWESVYEGAAATLQVP